MLDHVLWLRDTIRLQVYCTPRWFLPGTMALEPSEASLGDEQSDDESNESYVEGSGTKCLLLTHNRVASLVSLDPKCTAYVEENRRRYHAPEFGSYWYDL